MTTLEFKLAVACCRSSFTADTGSTLSDLASKVDWPSFVQLARRHRIQGLVARAFDTNGISVPRESQKAISKDALGIAERNLRSAVDCARLLRVFSEADIDILFIKGLTLSALAYGDPFLKMSADIDILVPNDALARSAELLGQSGYELALPEIEPSPRVLSKWHSSRKESVWVNRERGLTIDLHTGLADNRRLIPGIGINSPTQLVGVGTAQALPTLTTEDLFAYLCVHGASGDWFRLKWITDLAALLARVGFGHAEGLYRHARQAGAGRAPAQALLVADALFKLPLAAALKREIARDPISHLLSRAAFRELRNPREPTSRLLGTALIRSTKTLLLPGWSFAAGEVKRQVEEVVGYRLYWR